MRCTCPGWHARCSRWTAWACTAHPHLLAREVRLHLEPTGRRRVSAAAFEADDPSSVADELEFVREAFSPLLREDWKDMSWKDPQELAFRLGIALDALGELPISYFSLLHHLYFICRLSKATLSSYISTAHPFLLWLARQGDMPLEERSLREEYLGWEREISDAQKNAGNREAMVNHLLQWVGEDAIGSQRHVTSGRYVHAVQRCELEAAIDTLRGVAEVPLGIRDLGEAFLNVMGLGPMRPGEALYLRNKDLHLGNRPFLVFTKASGAHTKTASGERVLGIDTGRHTLDLMSFLDRRAPPAADEVMCPQK